MASIHAATKRFWRCYHSLPVDVRRVADRQFLLLRADPSHPSLHFKQVGRLWSVRVGIGHRALAEYDGSGYTWLWIGTHAEYDHIINGS